jgi:hypothetical protein
VAIGPTLRFVIGSSKATLKESFARDPSPAILLSYAYIKVYLKVLPQLKWRDLALDSGAFTAFAKKVDVSLPEYIARMKDLIESEPRLVEVFSLDVIGDWKAGLKNTEAMWKAGIPAIPCYHHGEPEHVLKTLNEMYPKIALGAIAGRAMRKVRAGWIEQCFARVWPKLIHGFGIGDRDLMQLVPWHSTDQSTWVISPQGFGRWRTNYGINMRLKSRQVPMRASVEYYLDVEEKARQRWAKTLAPLPNPPSLRKEKKK